LCASSSAPRSLSTRVRSRRRRTPRRRGRRLRR
jgi:hypothetical protein